MICQLLMRHTLAPLRQLAGEMAGADLLRRPPAHGPRVGVPEIAALGRAFDTMLVRLQEERHTSARRAIAAQEAERGRIGRELHDEVGQAVTGVALELQGVKELDGAASAERLTAAARPCAPPQRACARSRTACAPRRSRTSGCAARSSP